MFRSAAIGAVFALAWWSAPPPDQVARFLGVFELPSGSRFEVTADGDGIAVLGIGLEAATRAQCGRWPVPEQEAMLRAAEDRCLAGLGPLLSGTAAPPGRCFAGESVVAASRAAVQKVVARVGPGAALQFAGTELSSAHPSWVRIVGARAAVWLRVTWSGRGAIAAVAESPDPPPFRCRFRVERADWAVATVGGVGVTLSVEGIGAGRTIVLEDAGGLVECEWVADLRNAPAASGR